MVKNIGFQARKNQSALKRLLFACLLLIFLFSTPIPLAQTSPLVSPPAQVIKITHGAHLRPTLEYGQEIVKFNNLVQKDIGLLMYFLDWNTANLNGGYFDNYLLNKIKETFGNNGPVIMLTWAPSSGKRPHCTKDFNGAIPLNDIIAGACDNYIRGFAQALKARPERFLLRFAHEMNISDIGWWPGHTGQDASVYVQMWRHVYDVFTSQNVPNVEWVWSPNYDSYPRVPWNDRNNYYPGDAYTDWIGLSGFNWYTYLNIPWMTFSDIYDKVDTNFVLKDLACRYAKPQILAEFGSVDGPGGTTTKVNWINDAYARIQQFPFVRSVVWFNDYASANPQMADFRVTTGTAANGNVLPLPLGTGAWTNAYKQAIASSSYNSTLPSLETATPPSTYCGNGEPSYNVTPAAAQLNPGTNSTHSLIGMLYGSSLNLTLRVPVGSNLTGSFLPSTLPLPWDASVLTIQAGLNTPSGSYDVYIQANGVDIALVTVLVTDYSAFLPLVIR